MENKLANTAVAAYMALLAFVFCYGCQELGAAWGLLWIGGYWIYQAREIIKMEAGRNGE